MTRLLALFLAAVFSHPLRGEVSGFSLEMDVASDRPATLQLFYDNGQFWSDQDSASIAIPAGDTLRPIRFKLPAEPIKRLRLDPSTGEGVIRLAHLRLLTSDGKIVRAISPSALRAAWQIQDLHVDNDIVTVRMAPHADDPKLLIAESLHADTLRLLDRRIASRTGLMTFIALVALGGAFTCWVVLRIVLEPSPASGVSRSLIACAFAAVFLIVAGERLAWLGSYANAIPFWDEWASDWLYLLMPLQGGYLDWSALFIPQSEHRIVMTRLLTLVTAITSGEWDPRIGMTASALMWGASSGLVAAVAMRAGRWLGLLAIALLAGLAAQPFDVVNIFWGGQSQMFALVLLMIACFVLTSAPNPRWPTLLAAACAGLISLGTMGSGMIAPGLAAGICGVRALTERDHRRNLWIMALIFLAIAVVGLACRTDARFVGPLYARSFGEFWKALTGFGAWPLPQGTAWWIVRNLPWLLLCFTVARRRQGSALDWFSVGLGAWALVGDCGLSYARPWMSPPTDTRHFSPLFVGVIAALMNALALAAHGRGRPTAVLGGLAALATAIALIPLCVSGVAGTKSQAYWGAAHEAVVYPFLKTGDYAAMQDLPSDGKNPYWNSTDLAVLLDDPLIWPKLPSQLRKRVAERPLPPFAVQEVHAGWVTLTARTLMKLGVWFVVAGLGLLLVIALSKSARDQTELPPS